MKKIIALILFTFLFLGCKKDIPEPPTESDSNTSGYASYSEYHVTFFNNNFSGSPIYVNINGMSGGITYAYSYDPGCQAAGCANFTLPFGEYTYGFTSNSGNYVTGRFNTGASQCITILVN